MDSMMGLRAEGRTLDEVMADAEKGEEEKDTPAESSTVENQEGEAESSTAENKTEEVPFHMSEFWKRQKAKFDEEQQALREEIAALKTATEQKTPPEVPQFAKDLFGENTEGHKNVLLFEEQVLAKAEERAFQRLQAEKQREEEAKKNADAWLEGEVASLKAKHGNFEENKLFKIVQDKNLVKLENGVPYWNLEAGLEILKLQEAKDVVKSQARKSVADISSSSSKGVEGKKGRFTIDQMRQMGATPDWDALGL